MNLFIKKPDIQMYGGVKVTKKLKLKHNSDKVTQTLDNLVLHSVTKVSGEGYESTYDTTIYLNEGDVLIFEDEGRGYIKPVEEFVTVREAVKELQCIKDMR